MATRRAAAAALLASTDSRPFFRELPTTRRPPHAVSSTRARVRRYGAGGAPRFGLRTKAIMSGAAMPNASLAGMLGVSDEKKARMEKQERERAAIAKRKKEADAKERKRKREAEKARVAQYEEAAAQEAASSAHESPGARSRRVVKAYLDNLPYFGSSNF